LLVVVCAVNKELTILNIDLHLPDLNCSVSTLKLTVLKNAQVQSQLPDQQDNNTNDAKLKKNQI
jgi:hypothetical protein